MWWTLGGRAAQITDKFGWKGLQHVCHLHITFLSVGDGDSIPDPTFKADKDLTNTSMSDQMNFTSD